MCARTLVAVAAGLVSAASVSMWLSIVPAHAQSAPGKFTILDVPGATETSAGAINDAGAVTGRFRDNTGYHGFIRDPAGAYTTFDFPDTPCAPAPTPPCYTAASGINNSGAVAGSAVVERARGSSLLHGFIRDPAGFFTVFDVPGGFDTHSFGINDSGAVAGHFRAVPADPEEPPDKRRHGFIRDPAGGFTTFDAPGALQTFAFGINNSGAVAGFSDGVQGFIRDSAGGYTTVAIPGATRTLSYGINNRSEVVGFVDEGVFGTVRGFVRDPAGAYTKFAVPGAVETVALEINDSGVVVGGFLDAAGRHGFIRYPRGFDWAMPERYGFDANNDGLVDSYPPNGTLAITPNGWKVDFTTDDVDLCDASLLREWWIDGAPADPGRIVGSPDPSSCKFAYRFPREGIYTVELRVKDANGQQVDSATEEVTVQDWLIVSLGDSVASGEGNPDIPSGASVRWQNRQCHRSALAGPARAARALEDADPRTSVTFIHLACSGAQVQSGVLDPYEGTEPQFGSLLPSQTAAMQGLRAGREVDAVLLSGGFNDVGFSALIKMCIKQNNCWDETNPSSAASHFNQRLAFLPSRYGKLATRLIAAPHSIPGDRVYVTEYFDPARDDNGALCDGTILRDHPLVTRNGTKLLTITAEEARWASERAIAAVNGAARHAANTSDWNYVGGIYPAFARHGYCAADRWIVTYDESKKNQGDEYGAVHPNAPGHVTYANGLLSELTANLYDGGDLTKPRPPKP